MAAALVTGCSGGNEVSQVARGDVYNPEPAAEDVAVPDADAVLDGVEAVRRDYPGADFLVAPTLGRADQPLAPFRAPDGYAVVVRCLTAGLVEAEVSDPEAEDAGLSDVGDISQPQECEGAWGWSEARASTGGTVEVTITAPEDTYWVAGVAGPQPAPTDGQTTG
ncbi:hypothetical protein [uncultured Pseudokineococcus sp.]|uniref:hypothetical protein n=1 Tax=uncultured Pseudokineococcus sp. TaxID=1642928 RepID=UPI00262602D4|nr:hypothetical protein [uncultured Pseudokineococcus sp.]